MCDWGTDAVASVPIEVFEAGAVLWADRKIDACLVPLINAFNDAKIYTKACCCGHGKSDASILLWDGRKIIIKVITRRKRPTTKGDQ